MSVPVIEDLRVSLNKAKATKGVIGAELEMLTDSISDLDNVLVHELKAREYMQAAAVATQNYLSEHLSAIVTKALRTVFDDPYEFKVHFVERRGTTECDLILTRDGHEFDPLGACGYGVADVVAFALRVAYITLGNKTKFLVLDEPARTLSVDSLPYFKDLLIEVSKSLQFQFFIVTHSEIIASAGDIQYKCTMVGKDSTVSRCA